MFARAAAFAQDNFDKTTVHASSRWHGILLPWLSIKWQPIQK